MFSFRILSKNVGIKLIAPYPTWQALHESLHRANEAVTVRNKEGFLMALAYDARKAYVGQRTVLKPTIERPEIGLQYGVDQFWPLILAQTRMFRTALGFLPNTSGDQAICFALEDVIECALRSGFQGQGDDLITLWNQIEANGNWLEENINSRCGVYGSWTTPERRKGFTKLLYSFSPMYARLYDMIGKRNDVSQWIVPEQFKTYKDDESWAELLSN